MKGTTMTAATISSLEPARKSRGGETLSMLAEHGPFGAAMRVLPPETAIEIVDELSASPRDGRRDAASIRAILRGTGSPVAPDPIARREDADDPSPGSAASRSGDVRRLFDRSVPKKDRRAALAALKERHLSGALGADLSQAGFQEMMDIEIEDRIDATRRKPGHEPEETWRNGYRETTLKASSGEIAISVPKLRKGTYYPSFFERWRRYEGKLAALFQEAWIGGISTRGMNRIARILAPCGISRSAVSRVCKRIDERVKELTESSLEGSWRIVYVDATYVKSHVEGRVGDRAVAVAIGIDENGERHVLGVSVMASESGENWREFLGSLIERGLRGVKLVVADGGRGLRSAVDALLPGADFQLCGVHWMRNVLRRVPCKWQDSAGDLPSGSSRGKPGRRFATAWTPRSRCRPPCSRTSTSRRMPATRSSTT